MRNHPTRLAAVCLTGLLAFASAHAATMSREVYQGAKDEIKALYDRESKACDSQAGNAKDICQAEAKGREKVALAQLEFNYTGKDSDRNKLAEAKREARYDIAKERCDDFNGNQKDVCVKQAKAEEEKAKADAKLVKETREAAHEAADDKRDAEYKVAAEACDSRSGNAKDACMAAAKARYGK